MSISRSGRNQGVLISGGIKRLPYANNVEVLEGRNKQGKWKH